MSACATQGGHKEERKTNYSMKIWSALFPRATIISISRVQLQLGQAMEAAYLRHQIDRAPTAFHKSNLTHVSSYRHGENSSKKRQGVKNLDSVCSRISYMQSRVSPCRITKAVVPFQNKIILKNFRPEPPPSVDRPKIILFQHGTVQNYFKEFQCFMLTWNHV